jgi:excinuclease ABC subunit C
MLQTRMESAAEREAFEDAARIRDAVLSLETTFDEQKVPTSGRADEDVLGIARHGRHVAIACFQIRDSALVGRDVHRVEAGDSGDAELLAGFAASYYARAGEIPPSIATPVEVSEPTLRSQHSPSRSTSMHRRRVLSASM